jgi:hypothetical protein
LAFSHKAAVAASGNNLYKLRLARQSCGPCANDACQPAEEGYQSIPAEMVENPGAATVQPQIDIFMSTFQLALNNISNWMTPLASATGEKKRARS